MKIFIDGAYLARGVHVGLEHGTDHQSGVHGAQPHCVACCLLLKLHVMKVAIGGKQGWPHLFAPVPGSLLCQGFGQGVEQVLAAQEG